MAKTKLPSRAVRWNAATIKAIEALEELREIQEEYETWRDNLPENLQSSPLGEKLETVCELAIAEALSTVEEANNVDLPLGFGRD